MEMPYGAAVKWTEANQHDFSKHDKRRHFRARSNERRGRNWRALVSVGRPEMKRRGCDLESESDKGHDNSGSEERLNRSGR
jgi:hypothetical protein